MLKNSPFSFSIVLPSANYDRNGFYKTAFLEWITENCPELTISGIDGPKYLKSGHLLRGIDHAGPGKLMTIGRGPNTDINWIEDPIYALEHGAIPVYDLIKDFSTIKSELLRYYKERYPKVKTYNTNAREVTFTKIGDYVRVGVNTYHNNNEYTANVPVKDLLAILL
jgi:hypothetical protein